MPGFQVVTAAVRAEATKWWDLADQTEPVRRDVSMATLDKAAFFVGDPINLVVPNFDAGLHQGSYESFRSFVESVLNGAVKEFEQIGRVLIKHAEHYEKLEEVNDDRLGINEIWKASTR